MSDCLFCRIAEKKIPATFEYEGKSVLAFRDIHPQAPVHLLLIPKQHIERISEAKTEDAQILGEMVLCAKDLAKKFQIEDGYRLVFNNGADAGQSVYHIHLHLLGGRAMTWPPG